MEEYLDGKDNPFYSFLNAFREIFTDAGCTAFGPRKFHSPENTKTEPVPLHPQNDKHEFDYCRYRGL
jgi:hypothetical protein